MEKYDFRSYIEKKDRNWNDSKSEYTNYKIFVVYMKCMI